MQLIKLTWSNMFSYGADNEIDFLRNKVTLIEGKIGAGKSSIPTILEELLYNKNSRDFKKTEIINNTLSTNSYSGTVEFKKDSDHYLLKKEVKTSAKVLLFKNWSDISAHTATGTYKLLEEIIGLDFTTFSKLVYQSVKSQIDFLSATDAKRKEFLVGLMNLGVYKDIEEEIKLDKKDLDSELATVTGSINILEAQVKSFKDKELLKYEDIPLFDFETAKSKLDLLNRDLAESTNLLDEYNRLESNRTKNIVEITKRISTNQLILSRHLQKLDSTEHQLKKLQDKELPQPLPFDSQELQSVTRELTTSETLMSEAKKRYDHFRADANKKSCNVCGSLLNKEESHAAALLARDEYNSIKPDVELLKAKKEELFKLKLENEEYDFWKSSISKLETELKQLNSDNTISSIDKQLISDNELLQIETDNIIPKPKTDDISLRKEIKELQDAIKIAELELRRVELYNASVEPTNSAIISNRENFDKSKSELRSLEEIHKLKTEEVTDLSILQKSIKELVSYKIENEIKIFEKYINEYLNELSSGKFALAFELTDAKLSVTIYNNGIATSINTLSSGEQTLVNLATLFAIRKVMLATNDLNLVFLDEVISVLGSEDKDLLVDLLFNQSFNTLLVSHGYDNKLCSKININKVNGISILC